MSSVVENNSQVDELATQVQQITVTKHGRPKKFQSVEEERLQRQQQNKLLRDQQKPYLQLRKLYDNHVKVFTLINICYPEKRVLNCVENIELFNKFLDDLKYH